MSRSFPVTHWSPSRSGTHGLKAQASARAGTDIADLQQYRDLGVIAHLHMSTGLFSANREPPKGSFEFNIGPDKRRSRRKSGVGNSSQNQAHCLGGVIEEMDDRGDLANGSQSRFRVNREFKFLNGLVTLQPIGRRGLFQVHGSHFATLGLRRSAHQFTSVLLPKHDARKSRYFADTETRIALFAIREFL
jgi:hypothetical protein